MAKLTPNTGGELNPHRPTVPDEIKEVSPVLHEYLQDQASTLRTQHNKIQAGDTTFPWEVLIDFSDRQEYTLGSLGKFFHNDYGMILARYVRFTYMNPDIDEGSPIGMDIVTDIPWHVTNVLSRSREELAIGIGACFEKPPSGVFGWVIVSGVNIQSLYSDAVVNNEERVGWIASGFVGLSQHKIGRVKKGVYIEIAPDTFDITPGSFFIDALTMPTKATEIPPAPIDIQAEIQRLEDVIERGQDSLILRFDRIKADVRQSTAAFTRSISMIAERMASVSPEAIMASIRDDINLAATYRHLAEVATANAVGASQSAEITLTAINTSLRAAQIAATDAGFFAESSTTMRNEATLSRNEAGVSAAAAVVSEQNAAVSETDAGTHAAAALTHATSAATQADAAEGAMTQAGVSAGQAATSAGEASTSATQASDSATDADGSASAASASATTATNAATNATNQADAAEGAAGQAVISASNASTSASQASTSASDAAGSAATATTQATNASNSSTSAGNSASAAATSASSASTSATNASTSASSATTQANNAATSAGNASTSATNASTSAAAASTSASSAATSAILSASVAQAVLNKNPVFAQYASAVLPDDWAAYSANANTRQAGGKFGSGFNVRGAAATGATNTGFMQTITINPGYFLFEATIDNASVTAFGGSGLYLEFRKTDNTFISSAVLRFDTDRTNSGGVASGAGVFSFAKLIQAPALTGKVDLYAMTNWTGGALGTGTSKTLDWYRVVIMPANAAVLTMALASMSTAGNAIAAWEVTTIAGDASAAIRMRTESSPGVYDSTIAIEAEEFQVWDGVTRQLAMKIAGSRALFTGDVDVGGAIRVGSRRLAIALQSFQVLAADGETIDYGTDLVNLPSFNFDTTGLAPKTAAQAYDVKANSQTTTSCVLRAKILTPGATAEVTQGPGTNPGGVPSWTLQKADAADSYTGDYEFTATLSLVFAGESPHFEATGEFECFVRPSGGAWTSIGTITRYFIHGSSGTQSKTATGIVSFGGTIGQHGSDTEFGILAVQGVITAFGGVTYTKQSTSGESSATPSGEKVRVTVIPNNS